MNRRIQHLITVLLLSLAAPVSAQSGAPEWWQRVVKVAGQAEPVPERWLQTEGGRHAHSLVLPDAVAKTVPFDFDKARRRAWLPWQPSVSVQYFKHLCDTEAGEWIFKVAPPQEGIYNARPLTHIDMDEAYDRYGLEAPPAQRYDINARESIELGTYFVGEPGLPYYFVEEPRRQVPWQTHIEQPYIRMSGRQFASDTNGKVEIPMQLVGIDRPTARYGTTWRGIKRARDREHSVAGAELIAYDLETNEVLAVRRQFLYGPPPGDYKGVKRGHLNNWPGGAPCRRLMFDSTGTEYLSRMPEFVAPSAKKSYSRPRVLSHPIPPGVSAR